MKYLLIGLVCPIFVVGCQSYPKNPSYVSSWDKSTEVNKFVPQELVPFKLPGEVKYREAERIPKRIIPVSPDFDNQQRSMAISQDIATEETNNGEK